VYTDGITEARDGNGQEYGEERLLAAVRCTPSANAPGLLAALFDDVSQFAAGPLQDDVTLIVAIVEGD